MLIINREDAQTIIDHSICAVQKLVAIEECSELIKAITKAERGHSEKKIAEEIADVLICIKQLQVMYDIPDEHLQEIIDYKVKRTLLYLRRSEQ